MGFTRSTISVYRLIGGVKLADDLILDYKPTTTFNRTCKINYTTNRVEGWCEGLEALKESIHCTLGIAKHEFMIYPHTYGTELESLIGESIYFAVPKVEGYIKDALLKDNRILEVKNFSHTRNKHRLHTTFTVVSVFGNVEIESVVSV